MSEKHPDIFTPEEAAEYLHLPSAESLKTLKGKFGLMGYQGITTYTIYYRGDLDRCAMRMVGIDPDAKRKIEKPLRLASER